MLRTVALGLSFLSIANSLALAGDERKEGVRQQYAREVVFAGRAVVSEISDPEGKLIGHTATIYGSTGKNPRSFILAEREDGTAKVQVAQTDAGVYGVALPPQGTFAASAMQEKWEAMQPLSVPIVAESEAVTWWVVSKELTIVLTWSDMGQLGGIFYSLDQTTPTDKSSVSSKAEPAVIKQVCDILLHECTTRSSENWVHACGYWLQFCAQG